MAIVTNWTDIVQASQSVLSGTTASERIATYAPAYGMFGNGMQVSFTAGDQTTPLADWSAVRFDGPVIPFDGTKVVLSAVTLMPFIGGTSDLFSIAGIGLVANDAANLQANMYGSVILDGRDSGSGGSSSQAFQIRNGSIAVGSLVYAVPSVPGTILPNIPYRLELEIQTTAERTDFSLLARWYRHDTNALLLSTTYTRAKPADLTSVRAMAMTYRRGWHDNIQMQIGSELYASNFPARYWNGTAWVRKVLKKRKAGGNEPMYPKARRSNYNAW